MADIQQWRRKIQPARVRTPAVLETEDSDELQGPDTPKLRLKRKVSSYFDFASTTTMKASLSQQGAAASQLPEWPPDQLYPDPKAEEEIDSLMCTLMAEPFRPLDARFNCSLMRIFECFLKLKEERDLLEKRVDQEAEATRAVLSQLNMKEKDWEDEKQDYKEEVKRLEILLSKASKRGLAEVTLARQDSKLRQRERSKDDHKETIFEFLKKTKLFDDELYNSQRAMMKPLLQSPSSKDRQLSSTLAGMKSMTNIHSDLPFGTPPNAEIGFSLTKASVLEGQTQQKRRSRAFTASSTSDSTFSSFSCEGRSTLVDPPANTPLQHEVQSTPEIHVSEIECSVDAFTRYHNVDPARAKPQLLDVVETHRASNPVDVAETLLGSMGSGQRTPKPSASTRIASDGAVKRRTVISKASGFFQRLRPQLHGDVFVHTPRSSRRFSFEPGDDKAALSAALAPQLSKDHVLRKSVSMDVLQDSFTTAPTMEQILSPVTASPTTSNYATEGRPASRIPTPVYNSGSLAKPRQEREDSASSLLTAIRCSGEKAKRSSSLSNSPPVSRQELNRLQHSILSNPSRASAVSSNGSQRLLDRNDSFRGSYWAPSVAKVASASRESDDQRSQDKEDSAYSGPSSAQSPKFQQENMRPMGC